ncbi:DDE-type integrase/transposase/recombinase [Nocardia fluminea]|uniref:DDE-type integrase/transposase/recombinase n=1 Tax=Nocardia fluminea TaxID=134984 RepID=UPI0034390C0A
MVDPDTVRTIMRELGLVPCLPRPFRPVTTVAGDLPDLFQRDFTAAAPGRKLVGDITYIRTWEGLLYLATALDCYSKKVVGYAMAGNMRTELVTDAQWLPKSASCGPSVARELAITTPGRNRSTGP